MPLGIDYVSPLPPVRSGIADYSLDLLPHLQTRCDLRLVRLPEQPVDAAIGERFELVDADRLGEAGRLALYQMGNNRHHVAVDALARRFPGVVTLHDLVLHHFLIERTVGRGDHAAYLDALRRDHGWIGEDAAGPLRWPGGVGSVAQFALPAHRDLLGAQRGVLVHSRWAADLLREEIEGIAVRAVPMGVPLPAAVDSADEATRTFRQRHDLPEGAPLLGSFGFQTPIKRTDIAVRALADPALAGVYLLIAGEVAPICGLEQLAAELGVADRVRFAGFLPFEELDVAIGAVDLCLNLRYPTAGETSASLLRILAVGTPAVVSDYAQFAELPDAGVVKVPPGDGEVEMLVARLRELLDAPEALRRMGEEARRHVAREHDPPRAADAMLAACRELAELAPLDPPPARPPRPTSIAWDRFAGEIDVEGVDPPWPAGDRRRVRVRLTNRSAAAWLAAEREGGVAVEVKLWSEDRDLRAADGWLPLPVDLEPGESHVFELALRRPLGDARLEIVPHLLGFTALADFGGPRAIRVL